MKITNIKPITTQYSLTVDKGSNYRPSKRWDTIVVTAKNEEEALIKAEEIWRKRNV